MIQCGQRREGGALLQIHAHVQGHEQQQGGLPGLAQRQIWTQVLGRVAYPGHQGRGRFALQLIYRLPQPSLRLVQGRNTRRLGGQQPHQTPLRHAARKKPIQTHRLLHPRGPRLHRGQTITGPRSHRAQAILDVGLGLVRILDKKVFGTLDQSRGCLIVYHEQKKDRLYEKSTECVSNLLQVVHKLSQASATLKKAI